MVINLENSSATVIKFNKYLKVHYTHLTAGDGFESIICFPALIMHNDLGPTGWRAGAACGGYIFGLWPQKVWTPWKSLAACLVCLENCLHQAQCFDALGAFLKVGGQNVNTNVRWVWKVSSFTDQPIVSTAWPHKPVVRWGTCFHVTALETEIIILKHCFL